MHERRIIANRRVFQVIENLMAFRHVATKIYGFLIDANKLSFVIATSRNITTASNN